MATKLEPLQQIRDQIRTEASEMRFFRWVAVCTLLDRRRREEIGRKEVRNIREVSEIICSKHLTVAQLKLRGIIIGEDAVKMENRKRRRQQI